MPAKNAPKIGHAASNLARCEWGPPFTHAARRHGLKYFSKSHAATHPPINERMNNKAFMTNLAAAHEQTKAAHGEPPRLYIVADLGGSLHSSNPRPLWSTWVNNGHSASFGRCPLYPRKRTSPSAVAMSASCQKRTSPLHTRG